MERLRTKDEEALYVYFTVFVSSMTLGKQPAGKSQLNISTLPNTSSDRFHHIRSFSNQPELNAELSTA